MSDITITLPTPSTSQPPMYQAPHLIATYSHLEDRSIAHSDASLSYYSGAEVGADLKIGYEKLIERDPMLDEHLDGLCQALLKFRREGGTLKDGALITWRGMLTRLLVAAFTDRDSWEMNALAFDGNVYLEDHLTRDARQKRLEEEKTYKQQSYFGYSFEAYSTTDSKAKPSKTAKDKTKKKKKDIAVNTNVQWCCVVKSKIGKVRLYMGGEVDCIEGEWQKDMKQCIELKTNMAMFNVRQKINFERKLMKHWAQSWLLGVPRIEVGFRNVQGEITDKETFLTEQIPGIIRRTPNPPWDANTCLRGFETLSTRILEEVIKADPIPDWRSDGGDTSRIPQPTIWRIAFQPGHGLTLKRLGAQVPEAKYDDATERWGFLPLAFVREMLGQ